MTMPDVLSRDEVNRILVERRLTPAWLADQIGVNRQNVYKWLDTMNPSEPRDPLIWVRISDALNRPQSDTATAEQLLDRISKLATDLALAHLTRQEQEGDLLAQEVIRALVHKTTTGS